MNYCVRCMILTLTLALILSANGLAHRERRVADAATILHHYQPTFQQHVQQWNVDRDAISQTSHAKVFRSILTLRGGKAETFFVSLVRWVKSFLGLTKPSTARYSRKKVSTEVKNKEISKSNVVQSKGKRLQKKSTESPGQGRLQREIQSFLKNPPHNCKLLVDSKNIRSWEVVLTGVEGTVFAGEEYRLKMVFSKDYPAKPPSVYFLKPVPKHVHVYSNGDICLNLLGRDWRPTMTAESLAVSILSMLSSAKEKAIPPDNAIHADAPPGRQQDNWMYHDDKC